MNLAVLPSRNGHSAKALPWLQQSVEQFFGSINWEDQPPTVQQLKAEAIQGSTEPLSLHLTVSQFFHAVNWDGGTIAAAPAEPPIESGLPDADAFTLDNFSDLF